MRAQAASADRRSPKKPAAISRRRMCPRGSGGSGYRTAPPSRGPPAPAECPARDLEVELRRVVERVLAALRLHLDELLLDAVNLRLERGCRTAQPRRAGGAFGALLPAFDLATERAHRVDRLMYVGELVADPETQRGLSVEVGLRRGRARGPTDLERGFVPLAADLAPNAVLPGCADRSGEGRLRRFPGRIVLDAGGVGMPHVPGETVEAGVLGDPRLARLLDLLGALLLRRERLLVLLVLRLGRGALVLADFVYICVEGTGRSGHLRPI